MVELPEGAVLSAASSDVYASGRKAAGPRLSHCVTSDCFRRECG